MPSIKEKLSILLASHFWTLPLELFPPGLGGGGDKIHATGRVSGTVPGVTIALTWSFPPTFRKAR